MHDRPESGQGGASAEPRSLGEIFPADVGADRGRELQGTWRAFCQDMTAAVQSALARGRSPPEIAYAIGELVHNYFRTRGVTLTSYELRRLVAELLEQHRPGRRRQQAQSEVLVLFTGEPARAPWDGDETPPAPPPPVAEAVFEPPPSPVVSVQPPDAAAFDRLLIRLLERVTGRLTSWQRESVVQAIEDALGGHAEAVDEATRQRLAAAARTELLGLGLIDRLWADLTVRAVFVNGPKLVFVERGGLLEPAGEVFRDEAHLAAVLGRLAARPANGVAEIALRDGSAGAVIFPPAAPTGPVLALRRAEPGEATLERLVRAGMLSPAMADLLRIAARSSLNMLVSGPQGSGKTALLAALARDLEGVARVVTVARHRQFRWSSTTKVELVVSAATYPMVAAAAARLRPSLLVLDSVPMEDIAVIGEHLLRGERGTLVAIERETPAALAKSADLVMHVARGQDGVPRVTSIEDGKGQAVFIRTGDDFRRQAVMPAFAPILHSKGYGEALARIFR